MASSSLASPRPRATVSAPASSPSPPDPSGNLDPAGYPGGEARSYNLEPFRKAPHACAIALVGLAPSFEGIVVGSARSFVAARGGPLRVGLNDSEPSNNDGFVTYDVSLRAPTGEEWLRGGSSEESQSVN